MRLPLVLLAVAAGICYRISAISYVGALAHIHRYLSLYPGTLHVRKKGRNAQNSKRITLVHIHMRHM